MANPLSVVDGDVINVIIAPTPATEGIVRIERLELQGKVDRAGASTMVACSDIDVPEDLAAHFTPGTSVRLVLFGAPSIRSRLLGASFGEATYIRLPPQYAAMRKGTWTAGLLLDAAAAVCVCVSHGWGCIPAGILALVSVGPLRMAHAFPTFGKVKRLLHAA